VARTFIGELVKVLPLGFLRVSPSTLFLYLPSLINLVSDFRGLGYALSWPLVRHPPVPSSSHSHSYNYDSKISWLGNANLKPPYTVGIEDARTGYWLSHLPSTSELVLSDQGLKMGDWDQMTINVDTIALHWLKWDEW
jgi:hypothetical protein